MNYDVTINSVINVISNLQKRLLEKDEQIEKLTKDLQEKDIQIEKLTLNLTRLDKGE